jgi:hypothetical protein
MSLETKSVLPRDEEHQLAQYCLVMEERFYGLRSYDIRQLAF